MALMTEVSGLISIGIFIAAKVIRLADSARRNREKCSLLKVRVEMIHLLLTELHSHWTPEPVTSKMLQDLNNALDDGRALVESCQERRTWSLVFRTQKKAIKFDAMDQRISKILETFHIANMILIVKTSSNTTAAKKATSPCASSSAGDVKEMVNLAVSIVEEARTLRQNREEIQQLVQFVEQVANLLQQLQSANQCWDPETKPNLDDLKDLLQQAWNILSHHNQPQRKKLAQAFSCAGAGGYNSLRQDPDLIFQVAYKIEYCVQILPVITVHQMHI